MARQRETGPVEVATAERIVVAAEELLRRHGLAKMNVVDIARSLGMSHANVYRHFASKAALREAVAERWLRRIADPLARIAATPGPAEEKLTAWVNGLIQAKRRKVLDDPEMFAAYQNLTDSAGGVVERHVSEMVRQVRTILEEGASQGRFQIHDLDAAARAVLNATSRFHHPYFVVAFANEQDSDTQVEQVLRVLKAGLRCGAL